MSEQYIIMSGTDDVVNNFQRTNSEVYSSLEEAKVALKEQCAIYYGQTLFIAKMVFSGKMKVKTESVYSEQPEPLKEELTLAVILNAFHEVADMEGVCRLDELVGYLIGENPDLSRQDCLGGITNAATRDELISVVSNDTVVFFKSSPIEVSLS